MLNSPLNYVGGKRLLRKRIIELIPEHTCYVEVFNIRRPILRASPIWPAPSSSSTSSNMASAGNYSTLLLRDFNKRLD
jgi:hypothetical protein